MEPLQRGENLGHYRVVGKIGAGGMGEVYRCEDRRDGTQVAVKVLTEEATGHRTLLERFKREATLASSLRHPHIVHVRGLEEADGRPFIVMEFVEGEDLSERIGRGPLTLPEVVTLGIQTAEALEVAHRAGLIHRDIKSSNILITTDGRAKVADFGLVKRLPAAADRDATGSVALTATGAILGTASFMSPEQTRGERLDARSDIFSLGVVLYHAATGRLPFEGPTALAVQHEIALVEPPAPSRARPGLPRSFDRVLLRALEKDRDRRYASAAELVEALRDVERNAPEVDAGLADSAAAPGRAEKAPNNLPPAPTSFIGRRQEMEEVARLLRSAPLVTMTGAGGCGKSRLGVQVARNLLEAYPDGAWFVDLAPLTDPGLVVQRAATVLGVREEPGRPLADSLIAHLSERTFLLVMDNGEHVAAACSIVAAAVVAGCPRGRVLVTSRVALGAPGETVWRLAPLAAPATRGLEALTRAELSRYESVRLFVDRAGLVQPGFALTDANAVLVGQICARLDGIPLAVELAAARVKVLPVAEILRRLEDRFRLLTAGTQAALPHQQTLRATVAWSHELLNDRERILFARLSVFAGGTSLEAVELVCADAFLRERDILDLLASLVDQSLLVPEEGIGGAARYRMLETLREYGAERLGETGERGRFRGRHASHFLEVAEGAARLLTGPEQSRWLEVLEQDHDNLRHSIGWSLGEGASEAALRFCGALWRFWLVRGYFAEGREHCAAALRLEREGQGAGVAHARMQALRGAAVLARGQSDFAGAGALLEESLRIGRGLGDKEGMSDALLEAGNLADTQGDHAEARSRYEESLALRRELGDRRGMAGLLHNLGVVTQEEGDLDRAQALYAESLAIHRELGNHAWEAAALNALASVALEQGGYVEARRHQEASLAIHERLGDKWGIAYTLHELGRVGVLMADLPYARSTLAASLSLLRELGDRLGLAETFEYAAALAGAEGDDERALRLAGAASAHRDSLGAPATDSDRRLLEAGLAPSRGRLGDAASEAAWADGLNLDVERAIELATPHGDLA